MCIGCQAKGKTYSPVSSNIGFGAWQATCSGEGSLSKPEMKSQNGLPVTTPWIKSNTDRKSRSSRITHLGEVKLSGSVSCSRCKAVAKSGGTSVRGGAVSKSHWGLGGTVNLKQHQSHCTWDMSIHWWMNWTGPSTSVSVVGSSSSLRATLTIHFFFRIQINPNVDYLY